MTTGEKSTHKSSIVQMSELPIFVNKFHMLANEGRERSEKKSRTTFDDISKVWPHTKKAHTHINIHIQMAWLLVDENTLYDFGSPNISSRENGICDNDN